MNKMKTNKKNDFIDDGITIASMDVDGMPERFIFKNKKENDVTKSEKKAMVLAAYKAFIPVLLCGVVGLVLAMLLITLWLK